jgi:hypothetical protein
MDEFVCLTVISQPGECEADFSARLSRFWTHMLRTRKDDFEKVYAEATMFERGEGKLKRHYLIEPEVAPLMEQELRGAEIDFQPIDLDETFSRYEAVRPDWMQIEH